jgi:hypothetical protein
MAQKGYWNSLVKGAVTAMRSKVSADKVRTKEGDIDLDLSYITERVIGASTLRVRVHTPSWATSSRHASCLSLLRKCVVRVQC